MKKITLAAVLLIAMVLPTIANAQLWEHKAALPDGGSIKDLEVNSNNTLYALSQFGSQIYYSTNNGVSWAKIANTQDYWNVISITVDKPTNTLYVNTEGHGLRWTSNEGQTWNYQLFYVNSSTGFSADIGCSIRKQNTIVAAESSGTGCRIYKSVNGGNAWAFTDTFSFGVLNTLMYKNDATLLAGTENGIFQSTDNGVNWMSLNNGLEGKVVKSISRNAAGLLFAAVIQNGVTENPAGCGLYVSVNEGANWTLVDSEMSNTPVSSVKYDSVTGYIYAANTFGVYRSTNGGATWTIENNNLNGSNFTDLETNNSSVFCSSKNSGISFSPTVIMNWQLRNSGITVYSANTLSVSANGDMHILDNSLAGVFHFETTSWQHLNSAGLPASIGRDLVQDSNGVLYAGFIKTEGGLFASFNSGNTWVDIATMPLNTNVFYNDFSKLVIGNSNTLYVKVDYSSAEGQPSQIYRTTNQGLSWTLMYTAEPFTVINDFDVASDGVVYVTISNSTGQSEFIGITIDGAIAPITTGFGSVSAIADLVLAPDDKLYVCDQNHLYKNIGDGWVALSNGGWSEVDTNPNKLYIDGNNNLYVTSRDHGLFYSNDDGLTWSDISEGLPMFTAPSSLPAIIPVDDLQFDINHKLYAISNNNYSNSDRGVYVLDTNLLGIKDIPFNNNIAVFPNPVADKCTVALKTGTFSDKAEAVTYNTLGQQVSSFKINSLQTQENYYLVDMSALSPGTYFLHIHDGQTKYVSKIIKK